jgi:hypothetical protein
VKSDVKFSNPLDENSVWIGFGPAFNSVSIPPVWKNGSKAIIKFRRQVNWFLVLLLISHKVGDVQVEFSWFKRAVNGDVAEEIRLEIFDYSEVRDEISSFLNGAVA